MAQISFFSRWNDFNVFERGGNERKLSAPSFPPGRTIASNDDLLVSSQLPSQIMFTPLEHLARHGIDGPVFVRDGTKQATTSKEALLKVSITDTASISSVPSDKSTSTRFICLSPIFNVISGTQQALCLYCRS